MAASHRSQSEVSERSSKRTSTKEVDKPLITNYGILTYTSALDYALIFFGTLMAFIHGAGLPVLGIALGGMTTVFLRAQNSIFVTGSNITLPHSLPPITQDEFNSQIVTYCYYYSGLGVAMFVTSYIQITCFEMYAERITHKLRQNYLKAILRQQIEWFDTQRTGNLTARLTDDLERVREGLGDKLSLALQLFFSFGAGYCIGFYYSWSMTLVMMCLTPFVVLCGALVARFTSNRTKVEQEMYAIAGSIAEETFSSIRTVHSLNGQKREITRFEKALELGRKTGIVKYFYMGLGIAFSNVCTYASYAVAFWYGSTLIADDPDMDRGYIFTVFFSVMAGSQALGSALPHLNTISTGYGAAKAVLKVLNNHPVIDSYSTEGVEVDDVKVGISVKDVHFTYPSRKDIPILKGVSLDVAAGQKIALVGASGSGKSTIVNLLLRFYDPSDGRLTIDGINVKDINVNSLRKLIGIVSQEPVLFDGTLSSNIKMGNEHATEDEVEEACQMANAKDFIERLPEHYETRVGERGVQLSGGQKQRIAIARALIKNPKILLLDEATSALDTQAEKEVQAALEKAQAGRTTIIVAHRLSTIRNCDKIYVFKSGEIVEEGDHATLMSMKGLFYSMTQAQILRQQAEQQAESDNPSGAGHLSNSSRKSSRSQKSAHDESVRSDVELEGKDKQKTSPTGMMKIFSYNYEKYCIALLGLLGVTLSGAVVPMFALVYAEVFNVYSLPVDEMKSQVVFWCCMFLVLGFCFGGGFFTGVNCLGRAGEALTKKLRLEAFKNLLRQDIAFFDDAQHGTGKLCTRFATDAPNVRYVYTRLPGVISSVVSITGAIVVGFIFGWQLALVLLCMIPLIAGSGYFQMRMSFGKKIRDSSLLEEAGKVAIQAVENVRTVQALNVQERFHKMYCEYLENPYKRNMRHAHMYGGVFAFSQCIIFFMYAIAFRLGAAFVNNQQLLPVDVYRIFFAMFFCGEMFGNYSSFIPDIVKARLAATLIFYLIEHPTKIDPLSEEGSRNPITGEISLQNLHFHYPTRKYTKVLKGFNLEVKKGETVAMVGHSGCGKSTVMGLIERFYNQEKGTILIDGEDIRDINIKHLREQICVVSQEPTLFDATILENITYGLDREVPHEEIVEAAQMANIHNFVLSLPSGYDTQVGAKGTQLSGGQKQRIAIARALVRKPDVLLLDEATSALDTESEKIVQDALEAARRGRTCLVIAHRLSTIQNSDVIALVENGRVAAKGKHEKLLRKSEDYRLLCKTQELIEKQ